VSSLKDMRVDVQRRNCRHRVSIIVKEMVPGRSRRCPFCRATLELHGDDGGQVQRALDDFERELKRLSRKLTIKF